MSRFGVGWVLTILMLGGFVFLLLPGCHAGGWVRPDSSYMWAYSVYSGHLANYSADGNEFTYWQNSISGNEYNSRLLVSDPQNRSWSGVQIQKFANDVTRNVRLICQYDNSNYYYLSASTDVTSRGWHTITSTNGSCGTGPYDNIGIVYTGNGWDMVNETLWYHDDYQPPAPPAPECGYTEVSITNNSVIPFTINIDDNSQNATSYEWSVWSYDYGDLFFTTNKDLEYTITVPDLILIDHKVYNGTLNDTCSTNQLFARQNSTEPVINRTTNITPPNYTPIIPTIPVTIPTIPSSINRTTAREAVNSTVLAAYADVYMDYWDTIDDGLVSFITSVIDIVLSPLVYATEQLSLPTSWLTELASQYSGTSNNIVGVMIQAIYAFPPKLANLVTYGLLLDLILVVMSELGAKK